MQRASDLYYRWRNKFFEGGKTVLSNGDEDDNIYQTDIDRFQELILEQRH